ncbi:MAG: hypothetical protein QOJ41_2358 [Acidobacteriaceae bacterium]|jgi:hypothetical protein|nr:hypothetical protein [Acidobacteriaceae bacterium]
MPSTLSLLAIVMSCTLMVSSGCSHHLLTDYRPLVNAGMSSTSTEQLKKLDTSDTEILQLVSAKQAGISDYTCVTLVSSAHQHQHPFASADAVTSLAGAGFSEPQILQIARLDKLDTLSGDAVTLRLIGLSDSMVQTVLQRRLQDRPTLSSAEIARLKNTGLTETDILQRIDRGMDDNQAEKEVRARETARNHYGTGFVSIRGRRRR